MIYRLVLSLLTMQKTSKYYWWLQIGGWGILALIPDSNKSPDRPAG